MSYQHAIERMGPTGFQSLAAALVVDAFGVEVEVMGDGRDGGRDLYLLGKLVWKSSEADESETWDGYTVFQVKHKADIDGVPQKNASWLWGEIRKELNAWADPESDRTATPDQLVFVTNVPLAPFPKVGGHDFIRLKIARHIEKMATPPTDGNESEEDAHKRRLSHRRLRSIRKIRVWDGIKVDTLLTNADAVRWDFPGFLTLADVFAHLAQFTDRVPPEGVQDALHKHAQRTLISEGQIYFDEAGGEPTGVPVADVAVDLPVRLNTSGRASTLIRYVLDRAENVLRPRISLVKNQRHLIVTGAPGNGKTTMSKFIIQAFRSSLLEGDSSISRDQHTVIDGTRNALARMGVELPRNRRWPIRVDLAEYAQQGGLERDSTLARWLAEVVSNRSNEGSLSAQAIVSWMRQWPALVVLDGLDEVTEPRIRKRLIEQVVEFANESEANGSDVLIVLTTRPVGFTENIAPSMFERVDLEYLDSSTALDYGRRAIQVRLRGDSDRIARSISRLEEASTNESLVHLLRTPLQVLIMTIIVDGSGRLAPDRYSLFWNYYDTIYKRERGKIGGLSRLLQEHEPQIIDLHQRVGFELQSRAELGLRSQAILKPNELQDIVWRVLDDAEFDPSGKGAHLRQSLFDAATKRLVLLAPHGDDGYGFDVRSLQELMAARFLTSGRPEETLESLRLAAPSPYWRNTWIFAAGRILADPIDYQHEALMSLVESLDDDAAHRLGRLVSVAPWIALDLIDDGMARSRPRLWKRLITLILASVHRLELRDFDGAVRILVRFMDSGALEREFVIGVIRVGLMSSEQTRYYMRNLQLQIEKLAVETGASLPTRAAARALPGLGAGRLPPTEDGWKTYEEELITHPNRVQEPKLIEAAGIALRAAGSIYSFFPGQEEAIRNALQNRAAAAAIEEALLPVAVADPLFIQIFDQQVLAIERRAPIGELLRAVKEGKQG